MGTLFIIVVGFVTLVLVTAILNGRYRRICQHESTFSINRVREGEKYLWEKRKRLFPFIILCNLLSLIALVIVSFVFIEYEIVGELLYLLLGTAVVAIIAYYVSTKVFTRQLERWGKQKGIRVYPEC